MKKLILAILLIVLFFSVAYFNLSLNAKTLRKDGETIANPGGWWDCNCVRPQVVDCHCVIEL